MISIVLVQPEHSGNIGAIARSMSNFDFKNLILINPQAEHLNEEAINRARHEKKILPNAKVKSMSYLDPKSKDNLFKDFDYTIAFTSVLGSDYNLIRTPLSPESFVSMIDEKKNYALIFGREGIGLTNEEIKRCDFPVTIGTSKKYSAMNLSHAVAVILYEVHKKFGKRKINAHIRMTDEKTKDIIIKNIDDIISTLEFATPQKKETQKIVWRRLMSKAHLTKRESMAVIGFLKKIKGE